jgi:Flp pilus assembly protein TadD
MSLYRLTFASALATALISSAAFAFPAAGPEKSEAVKTEPAKKSPKKLKCKRGETAKLTTRKGTQKYVCVKLKADSLPDAELYNQARLLADEGEYEWALDHLRLISNQNDAEVLNYTGYANRKAGRLETGIAYYHQALTLNPDYVQAREYLGEAYVLAGFNTLAQNQLSEIEKRCGTDCEAYVVLKGFMEKSQ